MAKGLTDAHATLIRKKIDQLTAEENKIPGCVCIVVRRDGIPIFQHASGTRGIGTKEPMSLDSIFWVASCTKLVAGIAAMQLIENGTLALDDADQVEEVCPELKSVRILTSVDDMGKPELVDKKSRITLRMLLTHTAGFGYTFLDETLAKYGLDELDGSDQGTLGQPLRFEPGTQWQYGVGIDWAGKMIERVTKMSLNDYFQKYIFQPLGIKNISMFPTRHMKDNLVHMHARAPDGTLKPCSQHMHRPLMAESAEEISGTFNSGGGGLFAAPTEFCHLLSTLLSSGTSPLPSFTHAPTILSAKATTEIFSNQIPQFPDFGRRPYPAARPAMTNPIPQLYIYPPAHGWGLAGFLTLDEGPTGRGAGTAHWAGLPNVYWWCDRARGVAGMVAAQIVPFGDPHVADLWTFVEAMVYAGLHDTGKSDDAEKGDEAGRGKEENL